MYNVGKCVIIYIYIIVHFLKMSECTKIMRTCTIKKIWALDPSIDTEYLYTLLLKNWKQ